MDFRIGLFVKRTIYHEFREYAKLEYIFLFSSVYLFYFYCHLLSSNILLHWICDLQLYFALFAIIISGLELLPTFVP